MWTMTLRYVDDELVVMSQTFVDISQKNRDLKGTSAPIQAITNVHDLL